MFSFVNFQELVSHLKNSGKILAWRSTSATQSFAYPHLHIVYCPCKHVVRNMQSTSNLDVHADFLL